MDGTEGGCGLMDLNARRVLASNLSMRLISKLVGQLVWGVQMSFTLSQGKFGLTVPFKMRKRS